MDNRKITLGAGFTVNGFNRGFGEVLNDCLYNSRVPVGHNKQRLASKGYVSTRSEPGDGACFVSQVKNERLYVDREAVVLDVASVISGDKKQCFLGEFGNVAGNLTLGIREARFLIWALIKEHKIFYQVFYWLNQLMMEQALLIKMYFFPILQVTILWLN